MDAPFAELLALIRLTVGYLGEQGQPRWWTSQFFAPTSKAFLAPITPRTVLLAQYHGIVQAAARVHDEHVGLGQVHHLFRLPEDLEHGIHSALHDDRVVRSASGLLNDPTTALTFLQQDREGPGPEGPVLVGNTQSLRTAATWKAVAGRYARAFEGGVRVYPYFTDVK
jgi:hypothetical protein